MVFVIFAMAVNWATRFQYFVMSVVGAAKKPRIRERQKAGAGAEQCMGGQDYMRPSKDSGMQRMIVSLLVAVVLLSFFQAGPETIMAEQQTGTVPSAEDGQYAALFGSRLCGFRNCFLFRWPSNAIC